jgi:hypothetical protein
MSLAEGVEAVSPTFGEAFPPARLRPTKVGGQAASPASGRREIGHVQARAARTAVKQAAEHNGPTIWAVRPIAIRANDATMDDLRISAGGATRGGTGENTADN